MAQWIRRLPTEQEILGSSPSTDFFFFCLFFDVVTWFCRVTSSFWPSLLPPRASRLNQKKREGETPQGVMRESNSRPPAPEAGIIPLDQSPSCPQSGQQNKKRLQGHAGVEPATYRAATDCSTTELMPLNTPAIPAGRSKKISGGAGYRSLCLLHAKQALYHLSYTPNLAVTKAKTMRQPGVEPGAKAWEASMLPIHHWRGTYCRLPT